MPPPSPAVNATSWLGAGVPDQWILMLGAAPAAGASSAREDHRAGGCEAPQGAPRFQGCWESMGKGHRTSKAWSVRYSHPCIVAAREAVAACPLARLPI